MYYLLLLLLYPIALLPFPVLYLLSDIVYIIIYRIAGYRKKVVYDNLKQAFPEKTDSEIRLIMKRFYHNFCDQWFEMIKLLTISKEALNKRMKGDWEILQELDKQEINTYLLSGHTFNWEWANVAFQHNIPQQFIGVYMPVKNKGVERLITKLRTSGGGWMISMKAKKGFQRLQQVRHATGLIADQNPSNLNSAIWLPFMHREAPFFRGPELLARRDNAAVVFVGIKKIKRGYYRIKFQTLTKNAAEMQSGGIMRLYVQFMEEQLRKQPENWLWTHKRWKHSKGIS